MVQQRLKASSLMEVIVSSLIMLIVFVLSMEIVAKLASHKNENQEMIEVVQTMKLLINTQLEEQIITYECGEIEVIVSDISPQLVQITLIGSVKGKTCQLKKIIEKLAI